MHPAESESRPGDDSELDTDDLEVTSKEQVPDVQVSAEPTPLPLDHLAPLIDEAVSEGSDGAAPLDDFDNFSDFDALNLQNTDATGAPAAMPPPDRPERPDSERMSAIPRRESIPGAVTFRATGNENEDYFAARSAFEAVEQMVRDMDLDQAERVIAQLVEYDPKSTEFRSTQLYITFLNTPIDAKRHEVDRLLKEILEEAPFCVATLINSALVNAGLGRFKNAFKILEGAKENDPSNPAIARAWREVKTLQGDGVQKRAPSRATSRAASRTTSKEISHATAPAFEAPKGGGTTFVHIVFGISVAGALAFHGYNYWQSQQVTVQTSPGFPEGMSGYTSEKSGVSIARMESDDPGTKDRAVEELKAKAEREGKEVRELGNGRFILLPKGQEAPGAELPIE